MKVASLSKHSWGVVEEWRRHAIHVPLLWNVVYVASYAMCLAISVSIHIMLCVCITRYNTCRLLRSFLLLRQTVVILAVVQQKRTRPQIQCFQSKVLLTLVLLLICQLLGYAYTNLLPLFMGQWLSANCGFSRRRLWKIVGNASGFSPVFFNLLKLQW